MSKLSLEMSTPTSSEFEPTITPSYILMWMSYINQTLNSVAFNIWLVSPSPVGFRLDALIWYQTKMLVWWPTNYLHAGPDNVRPIKLVPT